MKRVIIMGASSGIGFKVAEMLASRGVRIGIAARHTETMEQLRQRYPKQVEVAQIDITKPAASGELLDLVERTGGMDIYLHVAGIGYENLTLDPEKEVAIVDTNAAGFVRMIDTAYRYFRDNGVKGQIAAITSVAGTKGIGRLSAYSATKKFGQTYLVALEQLANMEGSGIRFTDIRPGWVDTPLLIPGVEYPMEMQVDYAARRVIKAVVRKERVCVFDWKWNLLVGLWRMVPNALWIKMDMNISKPDATLPPA